MKKLLLASTILISATAAYAQGAADYSFYGYQPCTPGMPECIQWPANDQYKGNWERAIQRHELTYAKCEHHLEVSYALTGRGVCVQQ